MARIVKLEKSGVEFHCVSRIEISARHLTAPPSRRSKWPRKPRNGGKLIKRTQPSEALRITHSLRLLHQKPSIIDGKHPIRQAKAKVSVCGALTMLRDDALREKCKFRVYCLIGCLPLRVLWQFPSSCCCCCCPGRLRPLHLRFCASDPFCWLVQ